MMPAYRTETEPRAERVAQLHKRAASVKSATVAIRASAAVRAIRIAISPRLAISSLFRTVLSSYRLLRD
jgi:hypothetical protein